MSGFTVTELNAEKAVLKAQYLKLQTAYGDMVASGASSYTFDSGDGRQHVTRMTPKQFLESMEIIRNRLIEIDQELSYTAGPTIMRYDRLI